MNIHRSHMIRNNSAVLPPCFNRLAEGGREGSRAETGAERMDRCRRLAQDPSYPGKLVIRSLAEIVIDKHLI